MQKTNIEWTDYSSNPIYAVDRATGKRGWHCVKVSPGCARCYAEAINLRFGTHLPYHAQSDTRIEWVLNEKELAAYTRRTQPSKVFLGDMTDVLHKDVPEEFIVRLLEALRRAPQHQFQMLTKRAERLAELGSRLDWPANVWAGVSVESVDYAGRIDQLRAVKARIRFLSIEPLLGPPEGMDLRGIHWAIVGGESGAGAREMKEEWLRAVLALCRSAGVACFVKQAGRVLARRWGCKSSKGGDATEWPEEFRVRTFPPLDSDCPFSGRSPSGAAPRGSTNRG